MRPTSERAVIGYHGPSRERSEVRRRYVYVLWFDDGTCYVGQSVDPKRRAQQHTGAWHRPFRLTLVGSHRGTYADLEVWEHAWRVRAQAARVKVWAAPGCLIDRVSASPEAHNLGRLLAWPRFTATQRETPPKGRSKPSSWRAGSRPAVIAPGRGCGAARPVRRPAPRSGP